MTAQGVAALQALDFTEIEAAVYVFLLQESPATGYRIARAIGKPVANTYKAIRALEDRGALLIDDGPSRLCRAVPVEELLAGLDQRFQTRRRHAAVVLEELGSPAEDDRVYRLGSPTQVMERARQMLARSHALALLDVFPESLEPLRADILLAVDRGVRITALVYRQTEIPGVDVVLHPRATLLFERWPGQHLGLVVDGLEFLLATLTRKGRGQFNAVWSRSLYLAIMHHNGMAAEFALHRIAARLQAGLTTAEVKAELENRSPATVLETVGYQRIMQI